MRQYNLRFAKRWPDVIFDLYDVNWKENISESLGVYVLGSSDKTDFIYPWGSSPIFYIGKSAGLSKRLSAHRRYILNAYNDHDKKYWKPKNQYGAAFGATTAVFYSKKNESVDDLEANMIKLFYDAYGAIPTANGAWPKFIEANDDV